MSDHAVLVVDVCLLLCCLLLLVCTAWIYSFLYCLLLYLTCKRGVSKFHVYIRTSRYGRVGLQSVPVIRYSFQIWYWGWVRCDTSWVNEGRGGLKLQVKKWTRFHGCDIGPDMDWSRFIHKIHISDAVGTHMHVDVKFRQIVCNLLFIIIIIITHILETHGFAISSNTLK